MNLLNTISITLLLVLTACGGGSTGDDSAKKKTDGQSTNTTPSYDYGIGPTKPDVQAKLGNLEIVNFPSMTLPDGKSKISWTITQLSLDKTGEGTVHMRFDNESDRLLDGGSCSIYVFKDGEQKNFATAHFVQAIVEPGESAMGNTTLNLMDLNGFANYDKMLVKLCNAVGAKDQRQDIIDGPVKVQFLDYRGGGSRTGMNFSLTNDLDKPIYNARCKFKAKIDNVIVDHSNVSFKGAESRDIAPGETTKAEARLYDTKSSDDFDSNPFDYANLSCVYDVRG